MTAKDEALWQAKIDGIGTWRDIPRSQRCRTPTEAAERAARYAWDIWLGEAADRSGVSVMVKSPLDGSETSWYVTVHLLPTFHARPASWQEQRRGRKGT